MTVTLVVVCDGERVISHESAGRLLAVMETEPERLASEIMAMRPVPRRYYSASAIARL